MTRGYRLAAMLAASILVCAAALLATAATAQPRAAAGGTLSIALTGDIGSLDPAAWRGAEAAYIEYQMYDTLLRLDPKTSKIVPGLAASWKRLSPTKYVFTLRKGVKFWNGSPLTGADVVYSYKRALKKDVGAWNVSEYTYVKSVTAKGLTVTYTLKQPDNLLVPHLTGTMGVVVSSKSGVTNGPTSFATKPMGTGPFQFVSQDPSQIVLTKNKHYWQAGKPSLNGLVFKIVKDPTAIVTGLRSGEIDATFSLPLEQMSTVEKMGNLRVTAAPSTLLHFLMIHGDKAPLNNVHARRAIAYAINNTAALQSYPRKYLQPATGSPAAPIALYGGATPTFKSLNGKLGIGNLNAAKKELSLSPTPSGFTVDLTYENDIPMYNTFALFAQQELGKIGIKLHLVQLPVGDYLSRAYGGKLDGLELSGWYNTYPSAAGILIPLASKQALGSTNRNFFVDPAFEAAANTAVHGAPSRAAGAIAKMEQIVVSKVAFLPIAYAANVAVYSNKVTLPPLAPILIWQQWSTTATKG